MSVLAESRAADRITRFGIVGAGLIGGSIAKAIAAADGAATILVHDVDERHGADLAASVPSVRPVAGPAELADCECVFVATPVSTIAETVRSLAALVGPDCIIIDCGSVKGSVVAQLEAWGERIANYVPGHPMSGGNSAGPAQSRAEIIAGSLFVLCPGPDTGAEALERAEAILGRLGAVPVRKTAEEHDRALALTSHLPHLIAFALVAALEEAGPADRALVAGSFRSMTRFAAGDARIWADIFRGNRAELLDSLRMLEAELDGLRELIARPGGEPLEGRLAALAQRRRLLDG